jgi:hypothetical protein
MIIDEYQVRREIILARDNYFLLVMEVIDKLCNRLCSWIKTSAGIPGLRYNILI